MDVIIAPTAQSLPPSATELARTHNTDTYNADVLTVPANLAGLPAINVPVPVSGKYRDQGSIAAVPPVGIQVIGQYACDKLVLKLAKQIEDLDPRSWDLLKMQPAMAESKPWHKAS